MSDYSKKWCPFVRSLEDGNCGEDEFRNPQWARCIGPGCAVWSVVQYQGRVENENTAAPYLVAKEIGRCGMIRGE